MTVHKTTIDVNDDLLAQAQSILGTTGIKDTIDAALWEIVVREARCQAIEHLQTLEVDPSTLRAEAWGP